MAPPFFVTCAEYAPVLFELRDGRFQLMEQRPLSPFMHGRGYLLVEQALAAFLKEIEVEGVALEQVVVFNPTTGEELTSHVRVRVSQFFRANQLQDLNLVGRRMLTLNDQYYFVSPELKGLLHASQFRYLSFSEGLSEFAAGAA